ncbi:MAG: hypothetical protein Q4B71_06270 [Cardiobacteriaceae bacterium]|nr:hypothetical protein [Cardiobacteriaceae bacterium]
MKDHKKIFGQSLVPSDIQARKGNKPVISSKEKLEYSFFEIEHKYSYIAGKDKTIAFILKNSEEAYFELRVEIQEHILFFYLKISLLFFFIYALICVLSYKLIEDHQSVNNYIYQLLQTINFPVKNPNGWNLPYLLSFLCHVIIIATVVTFKQDALKALMVKSLFKYPWAFTIKHMFARIAACAVFLPCIPAYYYMFPQLGLKKYTRNCSSRYDLCFLDTEDMFFHSVLGCYISLAVILMMLYLIILPINSKYAKVNWRKIK